MVSGGLFKCCEAMIDAGIENPNTREGIDLCLKCPYPEGCAVFENSITLRTRIATLNQKTAKELLAKGQTVEEIM